MRRSRVRMRAKDVAKPSGEEGGEEEEVKRPLPLHRRGEEPFVPPRPPPPPPPRPWPPVENPNTAIRGIDAFLVTEWLEYPRLREFEAKLGIRPEKVAEFINFVVRNVEMDPVKFRTGLASILTKNEYHVHELNYIVGILHVNRGFYFRVMNDPIPKENLETTYLFLMDEGCEYQDLLPNWIKLEYRSRIKNWLKERLGNVVRYGDDALVEVLLRNHFPYYETHFRTREDG